MENGHFYEPSRRIPKSLNECIAAYPIVEELYHWADRLKTLGEIVCAILIIYGIFDVVSISIATGLVDKGSGFITFLTSIIPWVLYVFIAYGAFRVSALLLEALATTVQCKVIDTKVALFNANKPDDAAKDTSDISDT